MNSARSDDRPTIEAKLVYRMAETGPPILKDILHKKGWIPFVEGESEYWNIWWKGSRYRQSDYESVQSFQRLNHFPNTAVITRKDTLFRLLKKLRVVYGGIYDFFPLTIGLPKDYLKFVRLYAEEEERKSKSTWICKPVDMSRGRGIFVFRDLKDLSYDCSAIVQRYISNPLLISGYKFDLRCYVLVRSYNPLTIYLYEEGLTRFATSLFDMGDHALKNVYSHLTNTSINKSSPTLGDQKEELGAGCRWKVAKLRAHFQERGLDFETIWNRIKSMAILTLLPVAPEVTVSREGCFEIYGFDVLIDENLKPYLLEVNLSPALNIDSQIDLEVKGPMLEDLLSLVSIKKEHARDALDYVAEQAELSAMRKKKGNDGRKPQSPKSHRSVPIQPNPKVFPESVGNWNKIYPFDDLTRSQGKPAKIGEPAMKNIINSIRKTYL